MAQPYLAEIKMVSFNFAPKGWALCNGQLLAINQNQALFSLLGTTYGGDGRTTFALPDLQGRAPVHAGQGAGLSDYVLGARSGQESVTLNAPQMPAHAHTLQASATPASANDPAGNVLAKKAKFGVDMYHDDTGPVTQMRPSALSPAGGSQPHDNIQPYLTLNFVIAVQGIFPSRD
jgi:microcystin-dependent protein